MLDALILCIVIAGPLVLSLAILDRFDTPTRGDLYHQASAGLFRDNPAGAASRVSFRAAARAAGDETPAAVVPDARTTEGRSSVSRVVEEPRARPAGT